MHKRILVGFTLIVSLLYLNVSIALPLSSWDPLESGVFDLVNNQRVLNGLDTLSADSRLHDAARGHSVDMATRDFFLHVNPDGLNERDRANAAGYNSNFIGENLAAGFATAFRVMFGNVSLQTISDFDIDVVGGDGFLTIDEVGQDWTGANWDAWGQGWMGSFFHRDNILNIRYDDIGIGYASDADSTFNTYWTQVFAAGDSAVLAVPTPGSLLLSLTGLVMLVVSLRRRSTTIK